MDIRLFLVTPRPPDFVTSPTGINQIPGAALTVPRWQLGVYLFLVGGGVGHKELGSCEVGGHPGCCCLLFHVLKVSCRFFGCSNSPDRTSQPCVVG